ncbi:MAG: 5-formyltetrahydrofolate cyclo-ligase [Coriobacteriales bacterium]|jgi:5-formyltetrahydrofolate cyclo-ligase|nr:5-formyltetrahydrofolate cyclo-ligase [Coriobacteriales bacterium]
MHKLSRIPHFHQTWRHQAIWQWFAMAGAISVILIALLLCFSSITSIVTAGVEGAAITANALVLLLAAPILYLIALSFSSLPFWLRGRGAPWAIVALALTWECLLLLIVFASLFQVTTVNQYVPELLRGGSSAVTNAANVTNATSTTSGLYPYVLLIPWPTLILMLVADAILGSMLFRKTLIMLLFSAFLAVLLFAGSGSHLLQLGGEQAFAESGFQLLLPNGRQVLAIFLNCLLFAFPLLLSLPFLRRISTEKSQFRTRAIQRRDQIAIAQRSEASKQASRRMIQLVTQSVDPKAGCVAIYMAIGSEIAVDVLMLGLAKAGYALVYPAIINYKDKNQMQFFTTLGSETVDLDSLRLFSTPFKTKKLEDFANLRVAPTDQLSAIILPGLAFDRGCNRLGYGGGYYDRYISRIGNKQTKLFGICFDEQVYRSIPISKYDKRLDAVVTPKELHLRSKRVKYSKQPATSQENS